MLASQRALFDIPRGLAYLNNASYSPLPHAVRMAGDAGVATKSAPWAMDPDAITDQAERVRNAAASFIGAAAADIAITPSVAYGVATAAANMLLPPGSRILLAEGEFPSQSYAWADQAERCGATLDVVPTPADGDWTKALLARILQPGLPRIAVAALTPLHWTDGSLIDLRRLSSALRERGAAVVVDATQAAGILPVDASELGADYVVFPTYKWLLGPYTLAFLYVAPSRQGGQPLERHGSNHGGGAQPFDGALPPLVPSARRFDMGERYNPVALPMALAGMDLLRSWGQTALGARLRYLTDRLATEAEALGWTPVPAALRPPHILGLRPPTGTDVASIVASLAARSVYVAERGGRMRLGVHAFNDEEDVLRFGEALRAV